MDKYTAAIDAMRAAEKALDEARIALFQLPSIEADTARQALTGYSTGTAALIRLVQTNA